MSPLWRRRLVPVWLWLMALAGPAWSAAATEPEPATAQEAQAAGVAPLRVRNLAPATALFGLPRALGSVQGAATEVALLVEHGNNFTANLGQDTAVALDGSTTVTSLGLRRGFGERWEWGLELPYVHHSGGFTDGFIDEFHDLFGFPDGGRDTAPRNRLDYRLIAGGDTLVQVDESGGHLGDVRGWLGYRLHRGPAREAALRAMVKAPTGRLSDLSGSDGTDVSLWLELADGRTLGAAGITLTLMAGITVPEDAGLPGAPTRDVVGTGHLGLHYPLTGRLTLRAQLDGHTDVIDSGIRQLAGASVQGTLGGSLGLAEQTWLDIGVTEDLTGASAPDVVFLVTLRSRL